MHRRNNCLPAPASSGPADVVQIHTNITGKRPERTTEKAGKGTALPLIFTEQFDHPIVDIQEGHAPAIEKHRRLWRRKQLCTPGLQPLNLRSDILDLKA